MTSAEFRFEWDPEKASRNLEKHGIGFEVASAVFLDPLAVSLYDRQHRESEERWSRSGVPEAAFSWWSSTPSTRLPQEATG